MKKILILSLLTIVELSHASDTQPVFKDSFWTTNLSKDSMTDKTYCTAFYNTDISVQVTPENFYADRRRRGGVTVFQYRIDNQPPSDYKTWVDGNVINIPIHLIGDSSRVRVQGLSVFKDSFDLDINTSTLKKALSACPKL